MVSPSSSMQPITASIASNLAGLMYAFKYNNKDRYFAYLDKLRPVMDDVLYRFYETLGKEAMWR